MTRQITSKPQMYALLRSGALGNTFAVWEDVEDFEQSGFRGLTGVRCADAPGAPNYHHLTPHQALFTSALFRDNGYTPVIYEASPDEHLTIQGEVCCRRATFDWELEWSTRKTHMRAALAAERNMAKGREAEAVIRRYFNEAAFQDLLELFERYPDHVVEFSAYGCLVGQARGRNVVIWEVRLY